MKQICVRYKSTIESKIRKTKRVNLPAGKLTDIPNIVFSDLRITKKLQKLKRHSDFSKFGGIHRIYSRKQHRLINQNFVNFVAHYLVKKVYNY